MDTIGNRYLVERQLLPMSDGMLWCGKDLLLKREVYIYLVNRDTISADSVSVGTIGRASRLTDERFMHILDVRPYGDEVAAVLRDSEGSPLLHLLHHHKFSSMEIVSLVYRLGKGMQEAMEESILGYSVTVDNMWYDGERLRVINYWSEGEASRRGAAGLCHLLYQLCVRTELLPQTADAFEQGLRLALRDVPNELQEQIITIARRVVREQDSLTTLLMGLHGILGESEHHEEVSSTDGITAASAGARLAQRDRDEALSHKSASSGADVLDERVPGLYGSRNTEHLDARESDRHVSRNADQLDERASDKRVSRNADQLDERASDKRVSRMVADSAGERQSDVTNSRKTGRASEHRGTARQNTKEDIAAAWKQRNNGTRFSRGRAKAVIVTASVLLFAVGIGFLWNWATHPSEWGRDSLKSVAKADIKSAPIPDASPSLSTDGAAPSTEPEPSASVGPVPNEPAAIPNLNGLNRSAAEKLALDNGLHYKFFLEANDQPEGTVFKQEPAAGTPASKGDAIQFWISKGKQG